MKRRAKIFLSVGAAFTLLGGGTAAAAATISSPVEPERGR
jgi:hypothetical protein